MLVLSPNTGQQIMPPCCDVAIEALRTKGSRGRLDVNARRNATILRAEFPWRTSLSVEPEAANAGCPSGPSIRVLLAGPDPCLTHSYAHSLARQGFGATVAGNGLDCVKRLRTEVPDVLVLDPDLLWGGGAGVLALMREDYTVPLVPTLLHAWDRGSATFYDEVFPVVRQVLKPLRLNQMEHEILAITERFRPRPTLDAFGCSATGVARCLQHWIARRTAGRVHSLHVEAHGGRILVHGISETEFGRQLLQAAVMESLNELGVGRPEDVDIKIAVIAKPC